MPADPGVLALPAGIVLALAALLVVRLLPPTKYRIGGEVDLPPVRRPWWLAGPAGLAGVVLVLRLGPVRPDLLPVALALVPIAVALSVVDLDVHRLPDVLMVPGYLCQALLLVLAAALSSQWERLLHAAIGGAVLFAAYLVIALLSPRHSLGLGDVKLAGLIGMVLGYLGSGAVVLGAYAGLLSGGAIALVLLLTGRVHRGGAIAFGPPMLLGAFLGLLLPASGITALVTG